MRIEAENFVRGDPVIQQTVLLQGDAANDDDEEVHDTFKPGFPFRVTAVQHFGLTVTAEADYEVTIDDEPVTALVAADPVPDGGNTGDGTVTVDAVGSKAKVGDYVLTCIAEAADGGTFSLTDPDGEVLSTAIAVGTPYVGDHLSVTVADGDADWDEDDFVTVSLRSAVVPEDATRADATLRHDSYLQGDEDAELALKTTCDANGVTTGLKVWVQYEPQAARAAY